MDDTVSEPLPAAAPADQPVAMLSVLKPAITPGWQTTEFWSHALLIAGLVVGSVEGLPLKWAAIAAAVSGSAYSIARALTKSSGGN